MTTLSEYLHDATLDALTSCTERQRDVYQRVHGISVVGAMQPQQLVDVAADLNIPKQRVDEALNAARAKVYEALAKALIVRIRIYEQDDELDLPQYGTYYETDEYSANRGVTFTHSATSSVRLGPGSEAMVKAAKHGSHRTRSATINAHQTYARGGAS